MRPCLKRQPSKAQGFTAAAVLEEIHRAKQKFFFLPISHHPPRAPGRRLGALQSKAPGVRVSFGRLPDCRSDHQSAPKRKKHSFFSEFLPEERQEGGNLFQKYKKIGFDLGGCG